MPSSPSSSFASPFSSHYNWMVSLLLVLFGSSTWLCINGIWMELSVYAVELPESWNLPNWLSTFIEVACISPFLYGLILSKLSSSSSPSPAPFILAILLSSSLSILLLAFLWQQTLWLFGSPRSIALIGLAFFMALGSALSNVSFLPYLAQFPGQYLAIFFIGMSFSASIPSFLKLAQGVGDFECAPHELQNGTTIIEPIFLPPRFSVQFYNLALFLWMCSATFAFILLHFRFRKLVTNEEEEEEEGRRRRSVASQCPSPMPPFSVPGDGRMRFLALSASIGLVSALMNNLVPSVHSFATLPYSLSTYHLALTLANIAHTGANLFALWFRPRHLAILLSLVALCLLASASIFGLALQSPEPLFRQSNPALGSFIAVSLSVLAGFLSSYLRAHLTFLVREEHSAAESGHYLFLCGIFMQIGSLLGAIVMFLLVNVLQIFHKRAPCT